MTTKSIVVRNFLAAVVAAFVSLTISGCGGQGGGGGTPSPSPTPVGISFDTGVIRGKDLSLVKDGSTQLVIAGGETISVSGGVLSVRNRKPEELAEFHSSGNRVFQTTIGHLQRYVKENGVVGLWVDASGVPDIMVKAMLYNGGSGALNCITEKKGAKVVMGSGVTGDATLERGVRDGVSVINEALGTNLYQFGGDSPVLATITFDPADPYFADGKAAAYCLTSGGSTGISAIKIVTAYNNYSRNEFQTLFGHELGHGVGANHNPKDGMLSATAVCYRFQHYTPAESLLFRQVYRLRRFPGNTWEDNDRSAFYFSTQAAAEEPWEVIWVFSKDGSCEKVKDTRRNAVRMESPDSTPEAIDNN